MDNKTSGESSLGVSFDRSFGTSDDSPRILLWDIDGTLIRSARTGAFKDYTIPMLEDVFGTSGRLAEMRVSGMTDLQIVAEALQPEGITHEYIRERIDHLRESYMEEMHKATSNGAEFFQLLPGVREVLQAVNDHPRYHSALLTGNIEPAAYLKMELVGLSDFFPLPGAFGGVESTSAHGESSSAEVTRTSNVVWCVTNDDKLVRLEIQFELTSDSFGS